MNSFDHVSGSHASEMDWDSGVHEQLVWVAGDCLGNIYQLRLESEEAFIARLQAKAAPQQSLASGPFLPNLFTSGDEAFLGPATEDDAFAQMQLRRRHKQQLVSRDNNAYTQARERLIALSSLTRQELEGPRNSGEATKAAAARAGESSADSCDAATSLHGWAWHATSPFDWRAPVNLESQPLLLATPVVSLTKPTFYEGQALHGGDSAEGLLSELSVTSAKKPLSDSIGEDAGAPCTASDQVTPHSLFTFLNHLTSIERAPPAALPSLYTERHLAEAMKEFSLLPNVTLPCREPPHGARKAVPSPPGRCSSSPSTSAASVSAPVVATSTKPDPGVARCTEGVITGGTASLPVVPVGSYFSILTHASPSLTAQASGGDGTSRLSVEERRAWCTRQHRVLKEALRVQHYNSEARAALEVYNRRVLQQISFEEM